MSFMMVFFLIINFVMGFFWGYLIKSIFAKNDKITKEKQIYCKGFENGIYYAIGERNPQFFKLKVAENSFLEQKRINKIETH
jgi:hypothetical protein